MAKAPKEEVKEQTPMEKLGFKTAANLIEEFKTKRVYYIKPLSLALSTARRDPFTGLPGIPHGSILEFGGGPGKTKSACAEAFAICIMDDPIDKNNEVAWLNFEYPDQERWQYLFKNYADRVHTLDYTNPAMTKAEDGLALLISLGAEAHPKGAFPKIKAVFIDSLGAMAVEKEIKDPKTGEFIPIEKHAQMAIRAQRIKSFMLQWNSLNPNTRPILVVINHMTDQLKPEQIGMDAMKVNKIGEDLNYITPGGWLFKYLAHMRVRFDARKWPDASEVDKHEVVDGKVYDALEGIYEVYRSKFLPGRHWARAVFNMEDRTNCHYEEEMELLNICAYLEIGDIVKLPGKKWKIGKDFEGKMPAAIKYMKDRPELINSLILECAKPGNPERFHAPAGKKDSVTRVNADQEL